MPQAPLFTLDFADINPIAMQHSLGGMSARRFLRDCWQKQPLLIRQALPGFEGVIAPAALFRLASRDEVESRLIKQTRNGWQLAQGPFTARDFSTAPKRNWTLLVQDLNHFLPEAAALLQRFAFIPHARLDDVMVSYAVEGGGVGPHFDSYDVFLLQGMGQRRWQISAQEDHELLGHAPLKILSQFHAEQEWLLDPGDMLYLPPGYAHHGVAKSECMTYSIGFRAPTAQDLGTAFLAHLQDTLSLDGVYKDPDLRVTEHPGNIPADMVDKVVTMLDQIRWDNAGAADFLGAYLSEPKPQVFFSPPAAPLSRERFAAQVAISGLELALKSRFLYRRNRFYLNGELFLAPKLAISTLRDLADRRCVPRLGTLDKNTLDENTLARLYDWYRAGYVELISGKSKQQQVMRGD